jgi:hypothetical protein
MKLVILILIFTPFLVSGFAEFFIGYFIILFLFVAYIILVG